ncbi:MAG: iron-containing alcohol dehydrogenase, partial [Gammaproteobacteria bacterium]|nr:iron-containing alcohol dehydrogenase [Gammaproteobacteria bacterium]
MLFAIKIKLYRAIVSSLKLATKLIPMPKPVLFTGSGASQQLCEAISLVGVKRLLIVTDEILLQLGILDEMNKQLTEYGIELFIFDGVLPDPTNAQVERGLSLYQQNNCDGILAVGGGSPIDCAKVIAARVTNKKSIKKLTGLFKVFKATAPLFAIPTTAGTGSEVTIAAVISDTETHQKSLIIDPKLVPMMAALDGSLMTGLPAHVTAATGIDALTHAIEAFISQNAAPDTDGYAIAATQLIMDNLEIVMEQGSNLDARHNMAMAAHYAGLAFTKAGVGYVHAIAHNFGAKYSIPHGLANAIVLPYILDYSKHKTQSRLAKLAQVSGLASESTNDEALAETFIAHVRSLLIKFDIPEKPEQLLKADIPEIARLALKEAHHNYAVPVYMDQQQCET